MCRRLVPSMSAAVVLDRTDRKCKRRRSSCRRRWAEGAVAQTAPPRVLAAVGVSLALVGILAAVESWVGTSARKSAQSTERVTRLSTNNTRRPTIPPIVAKETTLHEEEKNFYMLHRKSK